MFKYHIATGVIHMDSFNSTYIYIKVEGEKALGISTTS